MNNDTMILLPAFLDAVGLDEPPMGIFFTDKKPAAGFAPVPMELPTRDKEIRDEIDWQKIFSQFSCVLGKIWLARKKKSTAYFSAKQFGCCGGAFWLGFLDALPETVNHYVSTGLPNGVNGEFYCDSPNNLKKMYTSIHLKSASHKFCVFKPVNCFTAHEKPELVSFFARPEALAGLHQLATFVTNDPEVVASPWSAACGSLVIWPFHYLSKGLNKAVIGGWDPSARKFFKTDELSFTVPFGMFVQMVNRFDESFLKTKTWATVKKKIVQSKKAWKETSCFK